MEEKKNGNISTLLGIIIICIFVGIISFFITNMVFNKLYNNSDNTDNNKTTDNNVINDNSNKVVTSDHITNDKVQAIYDQVKIDLITPYYNDGFFDNLKSKIDIILRYQEFEKLQLNNEQIDYLKKYEEKLMIYTQDKFVSSNKVIEKMYDIYNVKISKENFISVEKNESSENTLYGFGTYIYSEKVDGFIELNWGDGRASYIYEQIYNYEETSTTAMVDTLIAYIGPDKQDVYSIYNVFDHNDPIYQNINTNTFKFSEEDKDKFTKIRYTFTKRDDGSYYVSDIKKIN